MSCQHGNHTLTTHTHTPTHTDEQHEVHSLGELLFSLRGENYISHLGLIPCIVTYCYIVIAAFVIFRLENNLPVAIWSSV